MHCNQCGAQSPAGAAFCSQCGASLAADGVSRLTGTTRAATPAPPEKELWSGSYSAKAMVGPFVGATLLTVVGIILINITNYHSAWIAFVVAIAVMWGALLLSLLVNRLSVRYSLTTYRLFHERGLLNRTRDRIEVMDIDDVTLTQGLVERLLNVGTIHIISSDESLKQRAREKAGGDGTANVDGRLSMPGISDVKKVADLIDNTRRAERNRRGVYMENV